MEEGVCYVPILPCTLVLILLCSCAYAVNIHGLVDAEIMIITASLMLTTAHVLDGVAAPPYCMCTNAICILQFHMSNDAN